MRHDIVAKRLCNEIHQKDNTNAKEIRMRSMTEVIATHNMKENVFDVPMKTSVKCEHNKPDTVNWTDVNLTDRKKTR